LIRLATHDDLPRIVELGAQFLSYSPYRDIPLDPDAFAEFAGRLIDGGAIFLSEDGFIGGLLNPLYFNPAIVYAVELFWWAGKTGTQLREAFEAWARDQGAQGVQFTGLANEREATIRKVYERAGFRAVEVGFIKRF
jgi:GNAT superfamily N-acetyltransferase